MHLNTKIPKVVNIWASKCNIFTCAWPILFLSLRHEKLNTSPDWQSITPKMSSQSNVSAATACRCRFWTHFVHIFGQKSTVGGRCDKRCWTNVCNLTDQRWAHRGLLPLGPHLQILIINKSRRQSTNTTSEIQNTDNNTKSTGRKQKVAFDHHKIQIQIQN